MSQYQGFLTILAPSVDVSMRVLMGEGAATPTGGVGGWQQKERPDQKSFTEWAGNATVTQDIPIMINGFMDGNVVEGQAKEIILLGRNTEGSETPPVFRLSGPIWFPWLRWVLEDVTWTEEVIRDKDTSLLRQELMLHVAEFVNPDEVEVKKIRHPYGAGKGPTPQGSGGFNFPGNIYIVRKEDTCNKIAVKVYGERKFGKKIAEKNNIRDPNKELDAGRELKLPSNPWSE